MALTVAPATPAPAGCGIPIVPPPRGHPRIRFAVVQAVARKARGCIVQHGREGIANAVREFVFKGTRGRIAQHVAKLVPRPARVGSEAQRLSGTAVMVVRMDRAVTQRGRPESHLEFRPGSWIILTLHRHRAALEAHLRQHGLAVGVGIETRPVPHLKRQLRELEVGVCRQTEAVQPIEELPCPQECLRGRKMIAPQGKLERVDALNSPRAVLGISDDALENLEESTVSRRVLQLLGQEWRVLPKTV